MITVAAILGFAGVSCENRSSFNRGSILEARNLSRMRYLARLATEYAVEHDGTYPESYAALQSFPLTHDAALEETSRFEDPNTQEVKRFEFVSDRNPGGDVDRVVIRSPEYSIKGERYFWEFRAKGGFARIKVARERGQANILD